MNSQKIVSNNVLYFAGSFIALLTGLGFVTGQQILHYFVAYGYMGLVGILLAFFLFLYVGIELVTTGYREQFDKNSDIYAYYCGQPLGRCYDYFSILFIYISLFLMISAADSTLQQQYDLPNYMGGIIMACCVTLTVLLGLDNMCKIIGKIAIIVVIISILLALIAIGQNPEGLVTAEAIIPHLDIPKNPSHNWFFAVFLYVGSYLLLFPLFLTAMGKLSHSQREARFGIMFGVMGFSLASMIVFLGLMANIEMIMTKNMLATLLFAENIHPWFAYIFYILIILGIYAAMVPLLWSVSSRFAKDKTNGFRIITICLASTSTYIALVIPYDNIFKFIAMVQGYNDYISILLIFFMLYKTISRKLSKSKTYKL